MSELEFVMGNLSLVIGILMILLIIIFVYVCVKIILKRKHITKQELKQHYKTIIIITPIIVVLYMTHFIFYSIAMNQSITFVEVFAVLIKLIFYIHPVFIVLFFMNRWINNT